MTTPFRLFSLPFIPLKEVLDNIGPHGIMILSLCSLRSKSIAVSYRGPSKDIQLQLFAGHSGALGFEYSHILNAKDSKWLKGLRLPTLSNGKFQDVQYEMDGDCLVTFWEDMLAGLMEIGNYTREIFNRDIYQVNISGKDAVDYKRLIKWTMETQKSIKYFQYNDHGSTLDEDLNYVLANVNYTEKLSLHVTPSEHFCPAKLPNFQIDSLHVLFSYWIKQHHVLAMDCKYIWMNDSKLTSRDFNVFLKHWMAGGCSQLKDFWVLVKEAINYEVALDGVEFTKRERDVERVYVNEYRVSHTIRGGFDVKRSNVTATIVDHPSLFWMIVW